MSMAPPIPLTCTICSAVSTPSAPVRACSRCGIHAYCGPEHQRQDWARHKEFCYCLLELTDMAVRSERHLRNAPRGTVCDGKLYDEAIGHFSETRPATETFMRIKYSIVHTLAFLHKPDEKTAKMALPEALECLRLCRSDAHGVRDAVPSFMLQLGQLQECYDYIKWCATCDDAGEYDWSNPGKPFLGVQGADMTEPVAFFEKVPSPFMLGALTFIKMALASMLEGAVKARTASPTPEEDLKLSGMLVSAGLGAASELPLPDLTAFQLKMAQQANEAFWLTHTCDADFWSAMLDPKAIVKNFFAHNKHGWELSEGGRAALPAWIANNAAIWAHHLEFIHTMLANV